MSPRHFTWLLSGLLLASVSVFAQTRGGGGRTNGTPSNATNGTIDPSSTSSVANSNASFGTSPNGIMTADKEGKFEFRTQSVLVQVPVVVTDKSGNHIHGLTKDNFHVFENGKEQKISNFEEVVATSTKLPVSEPRPGKYSNLTVSEQTPRTVTVIAIDTINTPFLDQAVGRHELIKFLANNLNSGQVLALMFMTSHGVQVVQGLTGDSEQLVQILKAASGEQTVYQNLDPGSREAAEVGDIGGPVGLASDPTTTAGVQSQVNAFLSYPDALFAGYSQQRAVEDTLNSFLGIAWALSGVPGRKSLIWATGGFPFEISTPAQLPGSYLNPLYERTMQALDAAQISVYPVDVRGLVANSPNGSAVAVAGATGGRTGRGTVQEVSNRDWVLQSTIMTLNELADMTGGKAFYNTNDLASSFKRAADDGSSYYLASYYLDTHNNHAGWRQLKVKVDTPDKKDTEVRAREGFFVTNATMNPNVTRDSDLTYALKSPIEGTGVPVTVSWLGTSDDGAKKKIEFVIHMPADGVSIEAKSGQNHLDFDFAAAAFTVSKKALPAAATIGKAVSINVPDAQMASLRSSGIDMKNSLELAPGTYAVRVVIRDNVTGKLGSVTAPLTVN